MNPADPPCPPRFHWARLPSILYHIALAACVFAFGVALIWRPIPGHCDFWAHAAIGRWACENGQVPHRSLFLWTADEPWVYHSWLTQVLFYGLTRLGNAETLSTIVLGFTALLALVPFALAWWVWGTKARFSCLMALPFVIAFDGIHIRFEPRPELITGAFLSCLLAWLGQRTGNPVSTVPTHSRSPVTTLVILALFCLWGNFHGAVVLGIQVLVITAICEFLQNRRGGLWKLPALLAVLAPLVVCVNPYGPAYWLALVPVGSTRFAEILEWAPVWQKPLVPEEVLITTTAIPALALVAWALNPNRRLAQLGWLIMFAGMFLLARRNSWPLVLTSMIVLALNANAIDPERLWTRIGQRLRRGGSAIPLPAILRWSLRVFVLAFVILHAWPVFDHMRLWRNFAPTRLENGIVQFVGRHHLEGRVFNDYENSSYFQWRFSGKPALYTDLINAYPDQVFLDYRDILLATERGQRLLDEQQIEIVILTTNRGGSVSLVRLADYLDVQEEWVRVYTDSDGVVWVRRTAKYEHIWRPLSGSVKPVPFAILERWGNENAVRSPATLPNDMR